MNDRNGPESFAPMGNEMPLGGANWRTMMATFVTRMERDHEALLDTLRERLDEAESEQRRLEARVAQLEARLDGQADGPRRPRTVVVRRPPPARHAPVQGGAPTAPALSRVEGALAPAPQASPAAAPGPGPVSGEGWQDSARAILAREAELLERARQGQSALEIAGALGRGVGEVQLVLRLAERASHAVGTDRGHEEAM